MTEPRDEFRNGFWMVPTGAAEMREATLYECSREIVRLRARLTELERKLIGGNRPPGEWLEWGDKP
jgi:hypothetical protein